VVYTSDKIIEEIRKLRTVDELEILLLFTLEEIKYRIFKEGRDNRI